MTSIGVKWYYNMAGGESGQEDEILPQHDNFLKEGFKRVIKKLLTNDLIHDKISELLLATNLDNWTVKQPWKILRE